MEKWEWDTFEEINKIRYTQKVKPLQWCCVCEQNVRGSVGGKMFDVGIKHGYTVALTFRHWTPPLVIASALVEKSKRIDSSGQFSLTSKAMVAGALVLFNNNEKTLAVARYSKIKSVEWEKMFTQAEIEAGNWIPLGAPEIPADILNALKNELNKCGNMTGAQYTVTIGNYMAKGARGGDMSYIEEYDTYYRWNPNSKSAKTIDLSKEWTLPVHNSIIKNP